MDFVAVVDQVDRTPASARTRYIPRPQAALPARRRGAGRLKVELIKGQRLAADEDGEVLVWLGEAASPPAPPRRAHPAPLGYTPPYLAEKILTSRSALEGERKQVTVLFADLKGSTELIRDLDPEQRRLLDPALQRMMDAVHRLRAR